MSRITGKVVSQYVGTFNTKAGMALEVRIARYRDETAVTAFENPVNLSLNYYF